METTKVGYERDVAEQASHSVTPPDQSPRSADQHPLIPPPSSVSLCSTALAVTSPPHPFPFPSAFSPIDHFLSPPLCHYIASLFLECGGVNLSLAHRRVHPS